MAEIEHRHLRSALEFAVLMASEGQKRKPALPYPKRAEAVLQQATTAERRLGSTCGGSLTTTRSFGRGSRQERFPNSSTKSVDCGSSIVTAGLMRQVNSRLEIDAVAESGDVQAQLRRADKRRDAAEQVAARTRAELIQRNEFIELQATEVDELRAEVAKAGELLAEMKAELADVRMEIRHARDREAAAVAKAQTAADERRSVRDQPVPAQDPETAQVPDHSDDIAAAAETARRLVAQLETLLVPHQEDDVEAAPRERRSQRAPLVLPGGVIASSGEAAEFLARSDAQLIIDGYNVAKLGWPNRPLGEQRDVLLDAVENLARRFGTDVTVIFDGASVVGAHASRRRLARVVYSPEGTIADDVIRDEVKRIPANHAVVVVTNDAEIVRDVRGDGANVVPSNALLAIL